MKKLFAFGIAVLLVGSLLSSGCGGFVFTGDDGGCWATGYVYILANAKSDTVFTGDTCEFTIELQPDIVEENKIGRFLIAEGTEILVDTNFNGYKYGLDYKFTYYVSENTNHKDEIQLYFEVSDSDCGHISSDEITLTVLKKFPEITEKLNLKLTYSSTCLDSTFILKLDDEANVVNGYFLSGDLAFAWHHEYGYQILSPNSEWIKTLLSYNAVEYNLENRQNTKIELYIGSFKFDDFTSEDIESLVVTGNEIEQGGNGVQNLLENDILIFETQDGRKGVLRVGTQSKVTKNLNVDVKYQK